MSRGVKLTFRGKMGRTAENVDGDEQFDFSLWFGQPGALGTDVAPTQAWMDKVANSGLASFRALLQTAPLRFMDCIDAEECRAYYYAPGGSSAQLIAYSTPVSPVAGGTVHAYVPFQNSMVVTLTKNGIAKPKHGRFYLPPQSLTITQAGRVDPTQVQATANAAAKFVRDIESVVMAVREDGGIAGSGQPALFPNYRAVIHTSVAGRANQQVDVIAVGDIVDTQRRRRNGLVETYTVGTVS